MPVSITEGPSALCTIYEYDHASVKCFHDIHSLYTVPIFENVDFNKVLTNAKWDKMNIIQILDIK